jgi:hypothetical protein
MGKYDLVGLHAVGCRENDKTGIFQRIAGHLKDKLAVVDNQYLLSSHDHPPLFGLKHKD